MFTSRNETPVFSFLPVYFVQVSNHFPPPHCPQVFVFIIPSSLVPFPPTSKRVFCPNEGVVILPAKQVSSPLPLCDCFHFLPLEFFSTSTIMMSPSCRNSFTVMCTNLVFSRPDLASPDLRPLKRYSLSSPVYCRFNLEWDGDGPLDGNLY